MTITLTLLDSSGPLCNYVCQREWRNFTGRCASEDHGNSALPSNSSLRSAVRRNCRDDDSKKGYELRCSLTEIVAAVVNSLFQSRYWSRLYTHCARSLER